MTQTEGLPTTKPRGGSTGDPCVMVIFGFTGDFKQFATGAVDADLWEWFVRRISYVSGNFDDPATYDKLKETLAKVDQEHNCHGNYFFYLATAPNFFGDIVEQLSKVGLITEGNGHWRRVIIEKPFGH